MMFTFSSPVEVGKRDRERERERDLEYIQLTQEARGRMGTGQRRAQCRIGISRIKTATPERSESTF